MDRYLARRGIPPLVLSAAQLTAAAVLLALVLPFAGLQTVHLRWDAVAALAVLGILGTGIAYILNYRLITDEGTTASVVTYLLSPSSPSSSAPPSWVTTSPPKSSQACSSSSPASPSPAGAAQPASQETTYPTTYAARCRI